MNRLVNAPLPARGTLLSLMYMWSIQEPFSSSHLTERRCGVNVKVLSSLAPVLSSSNASTSWSREERDSPLFRDSNLSEIVQKNPNLMKKQYTVWPMEQYIFWHISASDICTRIISPALPIGIKYFVASRKQLSVLKFRIVVTKSSSTWILLAIQTLVKIVLRDEEVGID